MMKWVDYVQARTDCDIARHAMLASQLTHTITQTRLREAMMEGAMDQVAYLEARVAVLAAIVTYRTQYLAALTAAVEQERVRAVTDELDTMLTVLMALVSMMETTGPATPHFTDDLAAATALAERAGQDANTLPPEQWRLRIAVNEATMHVRLIQDRSQLSA